MTPQQVVHAALLRALREPAGLAGLPPGELDFTIRVLRRARLLGRIGVQVSKLGLLPRLPQPAADALTGAAAMAEGRARVARWELDRIAWALHSLPNVPLVAMKGCAYMLAGLPNSVGRLFADVDLLLPEAGLLQAEQALVTCGWRLAELTPYDDNYYRLWTHELPPLTHPEREVEVDLHHALVMRTSRHYADPAPLIGAARPLAGSRYAVLAPVDMALHCIAHLLAGGELDDAFRELVDLDDLLRHFGAVEPGFWEGLWPRAKALSLDRPVFYGLRYATRLLDTPVPAWALEQFQSAAPPAPILALMDRLVPQALLPQHPDRRSRGVEAARRLLFVRSHWLRMPPAMLLRHLGYKFYLRHLRRVPPPERAGPVLTDR